MIDFVLYSKTEAEMSEDDAGYWNEIDGWTTVENATVYPEQFPVVMIGVTVEWRHVEKEKTK